MYRCGICGQVVMEADHQDVCTETPVLTLSTAPMPAYFIYEAPAYDPANCPACNTGNPLLGHDLACPKAFTS